MVGTATEFDTVLELCRDRHRRSILAVLSREKRSLTVNDLTKTIVKHNHHAPITEVSGSKTTHIRRSLIHTHIPKLEAHSLVDCDLERTLVKPTAAFERLTPQLAAIIDADPGLERPVRL